MTRAKWIMISFGGIVTVSVALVFSARQLEGRRAEAELDRAVERAKKLGVLIHADQLHALSIPDKENAWVELDQAGKLYKAKGLSVELWPEFSEFLTIDDEGEFIKRASSVVHEWRPTLDLMRKASLKSGYYPKVRWEEGPAMLRPDLSRSKMLVSAMLVESRLAAVQGDNQLFIDDLRAAARIGKLMQRDHTAIGFLVSIAVESLIAREIVARARLASTVDQRAALKEVLDSLFAFVRPKDAFSFEPLVFVETIRMASSGSKAGNELRDSIKPEDRPFIATAMSTSPTKAIGFEAEAINSVCDYYESLSPDVSDYVLNDAAYARLNGSLSQLITEGFPISFAKLIEQLGLGEGMVFSALARRQLRQEAYTKAFAIVTGKWVPKDGETWSSRSIPAAELTYTKTTGGFTITVSAPDIDPYKLKL